MAWNQDIPAERMTGKVEMKDFTKNLSQVKASCASLLEQIAALQAAHEEAMAGVFVSEEKDVKGKPTELTRATGDGAETSERPLSLTTMDLLRKEPEKKAKTANKLGVLEKVLRWFRRGPSSQAKEKDPKEMAVKSCELPVKDECEPGSVSIKDHRPTSADPKVSGKSCTKECCVQSRALAQRIVASFLFKAIVMMAILANAIWLAFQTDWRLRNAYAPLTGGVKETEDQNVDLAFAIWFLMEVALRLFAEGKDFFWGPHQVWNMFDSLIVLEAWVTVFYDFIQLTQLRVLGVLRLARITGRIVRMMKTPKVFRSARTMMIAVLNSFADLFWSILVIALILFVYGVFLSEGAVEYFVSLGPVGNLTSAQQAYADRVKDYFGSMHMIMISLWAAVSGGNDWMNYGETLQVMDTTWVYFATFVFYIAFCAIGLFNVVTGVFVDSAVEAAQNLKSEAETIQSYHEDLENEIEEFKSVLKMTDIDRDGKVSYNELAETVQKEQNVAFWSELRLNPQEAILILKMLDRLDGHKNNRVDLAHFVSCARKLKGYSTKVEMMTLMYDQARLMDTIRSEFQELKALVTR